MLVAHVVMADIVMAHSTRKTGSSLKMWYSCGPCSYGHYRYGLYRYGPLDTQDWQDWEVWLWPV